MSEANGGLLFVYNADSGLFNTMADIGDTRGCGRALLENNSDNGEYGTTMALMLLPYAGGDEALLAAYSMSFSACFTIGPGRRCFAASFICETVRRPPSACAT